MSKDNLGDWCKWLETNCSNDIMIPRLPVIIRLDGNNFHNWTVGLNRPFDEGLSTLMIETTKFLVQETNAVIGYTQSDEITLILYSDDRNGYIYNGGKKQKILSKLTAKCVNFFNENRPKYLPEHNKVAVFDCRIYQTPTLIDAVSQLLWRENDATKNSKSMLARAYFSHKELHLKNSDDMQNMLMDKHGVNWNDLPSKYKKGTYVKRIVTSRPFSDEDVKNLPPNHNYFRNPGMVIKRAIISEVDYPKMSSIDNKVDVIFNGAEPILVNESNERLLALYKKGFSDQLDNALDKPNVPVHSIEMSAYDLGVFQAIVGDDVMSSDYKSNKEVLEAIKSNHENYMAILNSEKINP